MNEPLDRPDIGWSRGFSLDKKFKLKKKKNGLT